jgi:hypothetical protein
VPAHIALPVFSFLLNKQTNKYKQPPKKQVTEVYLEDIRTFCPLLRTDLRLSAFLDTAAKKGGVGGAMYVPACLRLGLFVCVLPQSFLSCIHISFPPFSFLIKNQLTTRGGGKPALDDRLMAVCVKTLSTVMKRGEAALVFVAGFADIEDLHALFAELPAHCAVEAVPFHSLISPEEQVGGGVWKKEKSRLYT